MIHEKVKQFCQDLETLGIGYTLNYTNNHVEEQDVLIHNMTPTVKAFFRQWQVDKWGSVSNQTQTWGEAKFQIESEPKQICSVRLVNYFKDSEGNHD